MDPAVADAISPNEHYSVIRGRALEIARYTGSPVAGAEHLFLGMLHDGGWPASVLARFIGPDRVEAAVLEIMADPGYVPPPVSAYAVPPDNDVQPWGVSIAFEMGDDWLGAEHVLLEMMRHRDSVPARALAALQVDTEAVEAAVLTAKNSPCCEPPDDAVFLPDGEEIDAPLRRAIVRALPEGTRFGYSQPSDGVPAWIHLIGPGDAREVLNTARAALGRPAGLGGVSPRPLGAGAAARGGPLVPPGEASRANRPLTGAWLDTAAGRQE
jgi:hypothetical protein